MVMTLLLSRDEFGLATIKNMPDPLAPASHSQDCSSPFDGQLKYAQLDDAGSKSTNLDRSSYDWTPLLKRSSDDSHFLSM